MKAQAQYTISVLIDGDQGEQGRSVTEITVEYAKSSSKEKAPTTGWSETMPVWEMGYYLWTLNRISYDDPTATPSSWNVYTTPVVDTAWEAANVVKEELTTSISEIRQSVDSISLSVTTEDDGNVSLVLNGGSGGGGTIDLTGLVTFGDLSTSGKTTISGDNITTGMITGTSLWSEKKDAWGNVTGAVGIDGGGVWFFDHNNFDADASLARLRVENGSLVLSSGEKASDLLIDFGGSISITGSPVRIPNATTSDGYANSKFIIGSGTSLRFQADNINAFDASGNGKELYLNYYGNGNVNIGNGKFMVYGNGVVSAAGAFTVGGTLYANGNVLAMNLNGVDRRVTFIDQTNKIAAFNYDGYSNNDLNGNLYGKNIELISKSAVYVEPYDLSAGYFVFGNTGAAGGCAFRPASDNYNKIGESGYRFQRVYCTNGITTSSDRRLKKNISEDFSVLEKVFSELTPVCYEYSDLNDGKMRMGLIAQDIEEILRKYGIDPDHFAVLQKDVIPADSEMAGIIGDTTVYSLNYEGLISLNMKMIQNLMKRVSQLEKMGGKNE